MPATDHLRTFGLSLGFWLVLAGFLLVIAGGGLLRALVRHLRAGRSARRRQRLGLLFDPIRPLRRPPS